MENRHWHRRSFLKRSALASAAAACALDPREGSAGPAIELSGQHLEAVNRRRRIVTQYDANNALGKDWQRWLEYRFSWIDEPGVQIDSVWWDIQPLLKGYYPTPPDSLIYQWPDEKTDIVGRLIDETRKRNLEVFWTHRISEVDIKPPNTGGGWIEKPHPFKQAHPDWVMETWWPHGLWDLTNEEVKIHKVDLLRHVLETYPLDGVQIDFARHIPCLPVGRQWQLRDHVTRFVRMVREMALEVAATKGRPILLAARVPRSPAGCREDGFDIQAWVEQGLVDILALGSRSIEVDIEGFRKVIGDRPVKLQPCLDDHHAPDGYRCPPIEVFRGTFSKWWQQGADSMMTFNWASAESKWCEEMGGEVAPQSQLQAYREVGSPASLEGKDMTFVVERRGGYPWADGYFNRNKDSPLPKPLMDDRWAEVPLRIAVHEGVKKISLAVVLSGAVEADRFELRLNAAPIVPDSSDATWKDPQVFAPEPSPASGGRLERYKVNPKQRLLRLNFTVPADFELAAMNRVEIRRMPVEGQSPPASVQVEKVELSAAY